MVDVIVPTRFKILVNGGPGTGKTWFGCSFPKVAYIGTEPGGLDSIQANPHPQAVELRKNLIRTDEFVPNILESMETLFKRLQDTLKQIHQQAKEGTIHTLVLDNVTFLSMNRWLYMEEYEKKISATGQVDTRGMYGQLALWLYRFFLLDVISFPGNVVLAAHEQMESEEDQKLNPLYAKSPVTPDVLGSMKQRISGLVSASLFLERKQIGPSQWKFYARCVEGAGKRAKNRYGLPELVEDISYSKLVENIRRAAE